MIRTIFIVLIVSSLALWTTGKPDGGLGAGWKDIDATFRPRLRSDRDTPIQPSSKEVNRTKITGVVVAYDNGVVLTDGPCRQSMVVRVTRRYKGNPKKPYILVRREYPCNAGAFPAEMFQAKRARKFSLTRDSSCDHTFEEIKDLIGISPASGPYRIPLMKRVAGTAGDKMPTAVKFTCYRLTGEIRPSGKQVS